MTNNLASLTTVGGDLILYSNHALTDVDPLSNLTSVGGELGITNNDTLIHLDGLWGLTDVGGTLSISDNAVLTDLAPTYLELAGIAVPGDVTGRSLVPLLAGREPDAAAPRRPGHLPLALPARPAFPGAPDRRSPR